MLIGDRDRLPRRKPIAPLRSLLAVGAVAWLGVVAAACGGASSPGIPTVPPTATTPVATAADANSAVPAPSPGASDLDKLDAYAACMRSHGIADFPDPVPNPGGPGGSFDVNAAPGSDLNKDSPAFQTANQACESLLPSAWRTPAQEAQKAAEGIQLAACLRNHGFPNFPDPNSQGAFNLEGFQKLAPGFGTALKTCQAQTNYQRAIPVGP